MESTSEHTATGHGGAATGSHEHSGTAGETGHSSGARSGDGPNFGSARSDYGSRAYGGGLNKEGLGGPSIDDTGRRDPGSRGYSPERRAQQSLGTGVAIGGGAGMLLLGLGLGAALMYIFDPDNGRRRRALLRDQFVAMSNDASDAVTSKARHLRNRAQGVVAETGKAIGVNPFDTERRTAASGSGDAPGR